MEDNIADLLVNNRTVLKRVILETPALLNMVKHCRESNAAQGFLMGVTERFESEEVDSLAIDQTMPKSNKAKMSDLIKTIDNDSQRLITTNEVGFYISSRMGLCFNKEVLIQLLESSKKFKNSVFIVYDTSKADYGLNPLHAYRLSVKAISAFEHSHGIILPVMVAAKITETKLRLNEMFEEIPIKVQRSHMQQAYLFDYIQPEMPAFNTNLFKLASPAYFESHVHTAAEMSENLNTYEQQRLDNVMKSFQKLKQNKINNSGFNKILTQAVKDDQQQNKLDYFMLAKQVDALCDQVLDTGIQAKEE